MRKGFFITFEGIDGSGKTTQIELLKEKFIGEKNKDVLFIREPGGTVIGEAIRKVLLAPESKDMSVITEILLYAAARAQMVQQVIIPALNEGKSVICDRYIDSSIAYQGFGSGGDLNSIIKLNHEVTEGLWPDFTFILDIDTEESIKRCNDKNKVTDIKDRIEQRDMAFYNRVRDGYLKLAEREPERIKVIPSNMEKWEVHRLIWDNIRVISNEVGES